MKRKTAILLTGLLAAAMVLVLLLHPDRRPARTLPGETGGILFSVTTFDGGNESEPFVKCLGHTWAAVDNQSGHSVFLNDYEIKDGETLTFSVWALSGHRGVVFNLEPAFIRQYQRYAGRQSLCIPIEEAQLETIEDYIEQNPAWKPGKNCSYWVVQLWNTLVGAENALHVPGILYTPKGVQKAMREFDCVETDRDFSRAEGVFFCRDGERMELQLCS